MQKHLIDLVSKLDQKKFEPIVVAPDTEPYQKALGEAVGVIELPIDDRIALWSDIKSTLKLARLLKELKPDILHIHSNKAALIGRIAARMASVKSVLVTVHNFLIYQERGAFLRIPAAWLERFLARWTTQIITVSNELRNALIEIEKIPATKIVTVHNGIDVEDWREEDIDRSIREKIGVPEDHLLIGTVGRFVPFKGQAVFIDAVGELRKKYPRMKAVIAGKGPLEHELIDRVRSAGLEETIIFPGFVSDVKSLIGSFDVFVLPSLKEPFGLVLLEAMAARVPIVATRAGGVPEIITDYESGLLVPPGDIAALTTAIAKLLDDQGLRKRLIFGASKTLAEKFSLEEMVEKTENLYLECLAHSSNLSIGGR